MRIKDLIEMLEDRMEEYGEDVEVHLSYPSGDYWKTTCAPVVTEAEPLFVRHSDYHRMPTLIEDEDEDAGEDRSPVIVLRAK